jgi:SAM-dependent methyltransferase/GNAT superfamily N-acetyltransferase
LITNDALKDSITLARNGFTVRHARVEDLAAAQALIRRVLDEDLGMPYTPRFHFDVDQPEIVYLNEPRQALFIAIDDASGEVIGTSGVRTGGPQSPPFPSSFTDNYAWGSTAQLTRVYIAADHRRRGVATTLVEAARRFIVAVGNYECIYFHSDLTSVGAEPFWRSIGRLVFDPRPETGDPKSSVHFELPMHVPLRTFRDDSVAREVDWHDWYWRWERQQAAYIPLREPRFDAMLDFLGRTLPEKFVAIDLMCGLGAISRRLVHRFPSATVIAIDLDPVLMTIGRNVIGDCGGRIRWEEANLADQDWHQRLGIDKVDAVLSTTAIHWLSAGGIIDLYRQLADVIRPGGVFTDGDQMQYAFNQPVLRKAAQDEIDSHREAAFTRGAESWEAWWLALREQPALSKLFADRDRRFAWRPAASEKSIGSTATSESTTVQRHTHFEVHRAGLLDAGFSEVDVIWQHLSNRVLVAVR